jgi:hypothetical protein
VTWRVPGLAALAVAVAAIGAIAVAPSARANDAYPCEDAVHLHWSKKPVQRCPLTAPEPPSGWVPVFAAPTIRVKGAPLPAPSGWLHGTANQYFVCEQSFTPAPYVHPRGWRNRWWAYTKSDDGVWGWVPEVYFHGGGNDEPDSGLIGCGERPRSSRPRSCHPYEVVGVRGSGESIHEGTYGMGETVGDVADVAVHQLGVRRTRPVSLRYPALPVDVLLERGGIDAFDQSIQIGRRLLVREVRRILAGCPRTRFGLIGYSQGAAAVSEALRRMPRRDRAHVRGAVLIADPYSRGGQSPYALTLSPSTDEIVETRLGHGALGAKSIPLPPNRVVDVCYAGDLVCDLNTGLPELVFEAMLAPVHTNYKNCCATHIQLTRVLGSGLASTVEGRRR